MDGACNQNGRYPPTKNCINARRQTWSWKTRLRWIVDEAYIKALGIERWRIKAQERKRVVGNSVGG
jgi:hypothetical protein